MYHASSSVFSWTTDSASVTIKPSMTIEWASASFPMPPVGLATLWLSRPAPPDHRGILFLARYHRKLLFRSYNSRIVAREVTFHGPRSCIYNRISILVPLRLSHLTGKARIWPGRSEFCLISSVISLSETMGSFLTFPDPPYIVEMLLGLVGKEACQGTRSNTLTLTRL
jgi:hypothetical protein